MEQSLPTFLSELDEDDFLSRAEALAELVTHPGFAFYREIVEVQARKVSRGMTARPLETVQAYAQAGGHVRGLEQSLELIPRVLKAASDIRARREREANHREG